MKWSLPVNENPALGEIWQEHVALQSALQVCPPAGWWAMYSLQTAVSCWNRWGWRGQPPHTVALGQKKGMGAFATLFPPFCLSCGRERSQSKTAKKPLLQWCRHCAVATASLTLPKSLAMGLSEFHTLIVFCMKMYYLLSVLNLLLINLIECPWIFVLWKKEKSISLPSVSCA